MTIVRVDPRIWRVISCHRAVAGSCSAVMLAERYSEGLGRAQCLVTMSGALTQGFCSAALLTSCFEVGPC